MRICVVIVTYNRVGELKKCIDANLSQTISADILIVDNASTDATPDLIKIYEQNDRVKMVRLPHNVGGAGGFYSGMRIAFEKEKYDYVWLMDDDGRPAHNECLENIMKTASEIKKKEIVINALVTVDGERLSFGLKSAKTVGEAKKKGRKNNLILGEINPFNGTLVSYETYKKIGLPRKEYFIKGDEVEYMLRAAENQIFIATCVSGIFYHPTLLYKHGRIFGRNVSMVDEAYWKLYYRARNKISNLKMYGTKRDIFWHVVETIYSALHCEKDRARKFRYAVAGLFAGLKNDFRRIEIN